MRLKACDCRVEHYRRGHRRWWMRLAPKRRLFHCYCCDALLFIDPTELSGRRAPEKTTGKHRPVAAGVALQRT